jgi:hypothetical protein
MEEEQIDPEKITKLGINVEGGANFEGDKYETIISLRCLACNVELESTPVKIIFIDGINIIRKN